MIPPDAARDLRPDDVRPETRPPGQTWNVVLGLTTLTLVWVVAVEVPARGGSALANGAETRAAWSRHAAALEQRHSLARLRSDRERLEERLAYVAGAASANSRPSEVVQFLEDAAATLGLTLLELRPLDEQREAAFTRLPISLGLQGEFEGLRAFLRVVERSPSVRVREVTLASQDPKSARVEAKILIGLLVVEGTSNADTNPESR